MTGLHRPVTWRPFKPRGVQTRRGGESSGIFRFVETAQGDELDNLVLVELRTQLFERAIIEGEVMETFNAQQRRPLTFIKVIALAPASEAGDLHLTQTGLRGELPVM